MAGRVHYSLPQIPQDPDEGWLVQETTIGLADITRSPASRVYMGDESIIGNGVEICAAVFPLRLQFINSVGTPIPNQSTSNVLWFYVFWPADSNVTNKMRVHGNGKLTIEEAEDEMFDELSYLLAQQTMYKIK